MKNLHKYKNYNIVQRYALYKILGLSLACEVLINIMNNQQLKKVAKIEFLSDDIKESTKIFVNKLLSKNV